MSYRTIIRSPTALGLLFAVGAAACGDAADPMSPEAPQPAYAMHAQVAAGGPGLAELRRATARFHRLEAAMAAGWSEQITPCLENPSAGGMGFHYANLALFDGQVNVTEPEALVYAPWRNGEVRLVAVEYIVPLGAWQGADPPELLGQQFHRNDAVGIWALHVWLWQHNPNGLFADWNPRISCG
ncbi:MAG TPA: hypothetical protein VK849_09990 [Longimicrobiales bacterium]|nr:hypothetical protein [Longimicrobiales bacterium]